MKRLIKKKLSKRELIERLKAEHDSHDPEVAHSTADYLLLEYINDEEISKAFDEVPKWYA